MADRKDYGILFSDPMVLALGAGLKTQTRRLIKNPDYLGCLTGDCPHETQAECDSSLVAECPYGPVGRRWWVREAWNWGVTKKGVCCVVYRADKTARYAMYDCDGEGDFVCLGDPCKPWIPEGFRWRPSIHMPRLASRYQCRVTGIRVERLQDISEEDARAEGVEPGCLSCGENCLGRGGCRNPRPCYRDSFIHLWHKINGEESWNANPWVWVNEFEVRR